LLSSLFEKVQQCIDDNALEHVDNLLSAIMEEWTSSREQLKKSMQEIPDSPPSASNDD